MTQHVFVDRINAVTLIYVFVCLGNSDSRDEVLRTEIIFDIMDFNKAGRISHDEMVRFML